MLPGQQPFHLGTAHGGNDLTAVFPSLARYMCVRYPDHQFLDLFKLTEADAFAYWCVGMAEVVIEDSIKNRTVSTLHAFLSLHLSVESRQWSCD